MRTACTSFLACLTLPAAASAQAIYVDFGDSLATFGVGAPSAAYGAAVGIPGTWNDVDVAPVIGQSVWTSPTVMDTTGAMTPVFFDFATVNGTDTFTTLSSDEPTTTGDDELLMDDIMYCVGAPYTITVHNLLPGVYDVYTYAMAPDSATLISRVDVPAGTGGPQDVGGAFPATGHFIGITYSLHTAAVTAGGTLVIEMDEVSDDSLNGLQLVPSTGLSLGTSYCGPAVPNSTGAPGELVLLGSPVAASNQLTLQATMLPNNQFGLFLNSLTQSFIPNPGGSQGNLCLGGAVGRYNPAAGYPVQNTGSTGSISIMADLTNTPTPSGPVAILAGQTWNFQCWYRDLSGGSPTSNFTDGRTLTFQ